MKEFLEEIEREHSGVIAIDFDGVIHRNSKGFHDGTIYDSPVSGAKEALEYLSTMYSIVIYTCKAKPERPLINGKTGSELIWEWLIKYDLAKYISYVTHEKPRAKFYIDDKGIKFESWEQVLEEI
jgi:hypothetical protein